MWAQTTSSDSKVIESAGRRNISAVTFTTDGHLFGADEGGEIRRWRVEGDHWQQVGSTMKACRFVESAIVSNDGRWLVTGDDGRMGIVWNAQTHEKVLEVTEHTRFVYAVDISNDSTRFATGSADGTARIFSIANGVRLIPPLQHDRSVVGLRFSPNGEKLVTATYDTCVRIYNSHTGDKLFDVPIRVLHTPTTPFAWSPSDDELFAVSPGKIACINTSQPSIPVLDWPIHNNVTRASIITNGHFIACSGGSSVSLWDAESHEQICPVIQHTQDVLCITFFGPHEWLLACGHGNRISIYNLRKTIPGRYLRPSTLRLSVEPRPSPASQMSLAPPAYRPSRRPLKKKSDALVGPIHGERRGCTELESTVAQCSAAVPSNSVISVDLLVERSKARAALGWWEDALRDAIEATQVDVSCHYAYECKYVALHGMGRYHEAIEAFDHMLSLMEQSSDPGICQLRGTYVSTFQKHQAIELTVRNTFKRAPLVLIDVATGCLCDKHVLPDLFRSDPSFEELISSMAREINHDRIRETVSKYFGYVMFSHVWGNGKEEEKRNEPSFKMVKDAESIHHLSDTPMNNKLRGFCGKVTELGYRWAWSDTCCIDKSNDAILSRSLRSMYKWYEDSDATFVFLGDVSSELGDILHSLWMTRAWTLQEALAPKRIIFYDRDWNFYRGIVSDNHKKSDIILQELANATGVPSETLITFHPDSLGVREKLRLASTRNATIEEDIAYSLIGIFKSDISPRYGEGGDALGHLLEGIIAHLGKVTVLAWSGISSSYNSCLPSSLAVYRQNPYSSPTLDANEMQSRTTQLSTALSKDDVMDMYHCVVHLPPARFANRRLQLPCVVFQVTSLAMMDCDNHSNRYRAKVSKLGAMEFITEDKLQLAQPRRLVIVHPWISDILGPDLHGALGADVSDAEAEMDSDMEGGRDTETDGGSRTTSRSHASPCPPTDEYTLALQMVARLQQPFNALLLQRQPGGEYKRVAAENEIIVKVSGNRIKSKNIYVKVLDIL